MKEILHSSIEESRDKSKEFHGQEVVIEGKRAKKTPGNIYHSYTWKKIIHTYSGTFPQFQIYVNFLCKKSKKGVDSRGRVWYYN